MENIQQAGTKTLAEMTAEVVENNTAHGWYENCATFPEAMALLHSEVSEALDAWRKKGLTAWQVRKLENFTACPVCRDPAYMSGSAPECLDHPDKPEGVGSEFADIFIRLLDDAWLFGQVDLEDRLVLPSGTVVSKSFPTNMNTLHNLICKVSMTPETQGQYARALGAVLVFLRQLCEHYGIDLLAEYARKMAYNKTRPYRHGNKRI